MSYKFRLHTGFVRDVATAAKIDSSGWVARCEQSTIVYLDHVTWFGEWRTASCDRRGRQLPN